MAQEYLNDSSFQLAALSRGVTVLQGLVDDQQTLEVTKEQWENDSELSDTFKEWWDIDLIAPIGCKIKLLLVDMAPVAAMIDEHGYERNIYYMVDWKGRTLPMQITLV